MSLRKKLKLNTNDDSAYDKNAESKYFLPNEHVPEEKILDNVSDKLLHIELDLVSKINTIQFKKPVDCVYSPIEYAYETHSNFVKMYCSTAKKILFLGLNPGPWGMSQTGVPFGEVNVVKDWLKVTGNVLKPVKELPARQINGLNCTRSEVSGKRFWGLFQEVCEIPENFFKNCYLHNYCPIALMKENGSNITPAELKTLEGKKLLELCDQSLIEVINLLQIEKIIAIGRFVESRVKNIFKQNNITNIELLFLLHPSPRVIGNENWPEKALKSLTDLDLIKYFQH